MTVPDPSTLPGVGNIFAGGCLPAPTKATLLADVGGIGGSIDGLLAGSPLDRATVEAAAAEINALVAAIQAIITAVPVC